MKKTPGLFVSAALLGIDALIGAIPVWHKIATLRDRFVFGLDFMVDIVQVWIPLVICGVIGFFAWLRYKGRRGGVRSGGVIDLLTVLMSVVAVVAVISIGRFKREESRNPVLFQASNGDVVGGLWIQLKTEHVYTLFNSGGIGYEWSEGTYRIGRDTIYLTGETDVIGDKLVIGRDSLRCPTAVRYRFKDEPDYRPTSLLRVVLDSLFCKN